MMTVTTDQQQQQQQQFHERITLDPFNKSPYLKGVKSTIETKTIIPHNVNASSEQSKSNMTLLPTPQNALLISILDELQLDSFTISTSDSSDSSISLPRAVDVEIDTTNNSNVWSSSPLTFPVGTAIQYTEMSSAASVNYGSGGVNHESGDFEKTLLRVLSKDGLLCNNVPLDEKLQTIYPTSIKNSSSLGNKNSKSTSSSIHSTNTNTNTIMISNDAYTLCHIESLYRMIIASSPCRDQVGVFSKFDFHTMNDGHVFQKASWMSVKRIMKDKHHAIEIDWGLRYQKRIMRLLPLEMQKQKQTNQVSLSDILLQTNNNNNNNNNAVSDLLQSCPLSTSSAIIVSRQHGHDNQTYDLKSKDMDMRTNIVSLDDSMSNFGTIGTQRSVKRPSGVAHFGAFHSKYYFDCDKVCQTNYDTTTTLLSAAEGIDVSILEYYPNVVKPVFHTFKAYLMSHEANQNGELTEIALDGKNDYHILISADGSSTIYLNYNIPPQSSLFTHIDFEPTYLPFEQFPADPNRGFDIPPSIASFSMPSSDTTLLYTNALLVMPPVPDMSMPFNVISLSSTCFAIIIATSINLIIKKSSQSISDKLNGVKRKSPMDKVKEKIQRIKAKFS